MKVRREFVRDGETVSVTAERLDGDNWRIHIGDRVLDVVAQALGCGGVRIVPAGAEVQTAAIAYGAPAGKQFMVRINGQTHTLAPPARRGRGGAGAGNGTITAPMTGTVTSGK